MILSFQVARGVVWLKRLALATESLARTQVQLVEIERQRTPQRRKPAMMEMGLADFSENDRKWRETHPPEDWDGTQA